MEAELLYSFVSSVLNTAGIKRWQEDVLYHWPRDGPKSRFFGPKAPPKEDDESSTVANWTSHYESSTIANQSSN